MKEKKQYTQSEVDAIVADTKQEFIIFGMTEGHRVAFNAITRVKAAVENMQAIYYIGDIIGERKQKIEELQLVWDTLTHLEDTFQGEYDSVIDSHKTWVM